MRIAAHGLGMPEYIQYWFLIIKEAHTFGGVGGVRFSTVYYVSERAQWLSQDLTPTVTCRRRSEAEIQCQSPFSEYRRLFLNQELSVHHP